MMNSRGLLTIPGTVPIQASGTTEQSSHEENLKFNQPVDKETSLRGGFLFQTLKETLLSPKPTYTTAI